MENDFLFEKEIRIFGLRRSGLHAANVWIWHHFEGRSCMYQNNTYLSFREKKRHDIFDERFKFIKSNPRGYINIIEHQDPQESERRLYDPNYEYNVGKKEIATKYGRKNFSKEVYNIVVLRNPFNLASIIQVGKKKKYKAFVKRHSSSFREMWVKYAYELIGATNFFPPVKVAFLFDEWFVNQKYREGISSSLGLEFTDVGLSRVTRRGSSFDGMKFKYNAQEMNVLGRWSQIREEEKESFSHIIDNDIVDLWEEVLDISRRKSG